MSQVTLQYIGVNTEGDIYLTDVDDNKDKIVQRIINQVTNGTIDPILGRYLISGDWD
jgi:hypothetical protein